MKTVIFDLDDTLLCGDSEFKWAEFTVEKGFIDKELYIKKITEFENDYREGKMDFEAYCVFLLNPLIGKSIQEVNFLVKDFINQYEKRGSGQYFSDFNEALDIRVQTNPQGTVTSQTTYSVIAQENAPRGITFNTDGTKMFITGTQGDDVNEYTL